jgi:hypothetical protein
MCSRCLPTVRGLQPSRCPIATSVRPSATRWRMLSWRAVSRAGLFRHPDSVRHTDSVRRAGSVRRATRQASNGWSWASRSTSARVKSAPARFSDTQTCTRPGASAMARTSSMASLRATSAYRPLLRKPSVLCRSDRRIGRPGPPGRVCRISGESAACHSTARAMSPVSSGSGQPTARRGSGPPGRPVPPVTSSSVHRAESAPTRLTSAGSSRPGSSVRLDAASAASTAASAARTVLAVTMIPPGDCTQFSVWTIRPSMP